MYEAPPHPSAAPPLALEAAGILFASVGRTGSNSAYEEGDQKSKGLVWQGSEAS